MNFDFAGQITPHLEQLDFTAALSLAETRLKQLPPTPFHTVLVQSLVGQASALVPWIEAFYQRVSKKLEVTALYFEMYEFDNHTHHWYIDGLAYEPDGGLDLEAMAWLCHFQADTRQATESLFVIEGYEPLQQAFAPAAPGTRALQDAREGPEQIIIARFMELMRATPVKAAERHYQWAAVLLYFTGHAYDFIVRSVSPAVNNAVTIAQG